MRLASDSPWPVALRTGSTSPREMVTIVACSTTWRLEAGRLVPAEAAAHWKPAEAPVQVAGVELRDDLDFRRQGVDVVILGQACSPGGHPLTTMDVAAVCGRLTHRSRVVGDRLWEKSWGRLRIGETKPFVTMSIGNERAFGGLAVTPDGPMPHAINPAGRGFHASAATVEGSALNNLEDPHKPIQAWTDRPLPSLWYKSAGAPPLSNPPQDPVAFACAVSAAALRDAPPPLCCEPGELGPVLQLDGFDPLGPLAFPLPPAGAAWCSVQVGERRARLTMIPSRIVAMPASRALVVTYCARFRWLMEPKDERSAVVGWRT